MGIPFVKCILMVFSPVYRLLVQYPLDIHLFSWETHFLTNCVDLYAQYTILVVGEF
jgi:hypothetical protein